MGDTTVTNTRGLSFTASHGGSWGAESGQPGSGSFCCEVSEDRSLDHCALKEGSMEKKMPFGMGFEEGRDLHSCLHNSVLNME